MGSVFCDWVRTAYARCARARLVVSWLLMLLFLFLVFEDAGMPIPAFFSSFLSRSLEPKDPKPVSDQQRLAGAIVLLFVVSFTAILLANMEATRRFFYSGPGCALLLGFWMLGVLSEVPRFRRLPSFFGDRPIQC